MTLTVAQRIAKKNKEGMTWYGVKRAVRVRALCVCARAVRCVCTLRLRRLLQAQASP